MEGKEGRRKGQHLTWMDRQEIQAGLRQHRNFREIAAIIGCAPETVSKEIRKHRYHKPANASRYVPNRCKHRETCRRKNVCGKKAGHKCRIPCRECPACNKRCPDFVDAPCAIAEKAPYVCNGCSKSRTCLFDKYLYNADCAQREYQETLHKAREGIDLTRDELIALDELVSPLIRKGQPVAHILAEHGEEIPCGERTLYTYISQGYLSAKSLDLRRMVRYRKRRRTHTAKPSPLKKAGRHYRDFQSYLEEEPGAAVAEMDTVEGVKGGKVLLTLFLRRQQLLLAFLLENKEMESAAAAIDRLETALGTALGTVLFQALFPVLLTDNGTEFSDPERFEYNGDGIRRTRIFYCDPRRSDQKGRIEKCHEYIRYLLPKGTAFDSLDQEKVSLMMSHINSTARPGLRGRCPLELAVQDFGKDAVERLGLLRIAPDDVVLTPKLFK